MLQPLTLRTFPWASSSGNIHKPLLRHISCPVVGCVNWQVRLINRMKNMFKKKGEKKSAEQGTEAAMLESFVKEFNPLILCAHLLQQLILTPDTITDARDRIRMRFQLCTDSRLK